MGCTSIEFLFSMLSRQNGPFGCYKGGLRRTLQKSMLFTPLLPSAGPTGGLGDAWPAPTISLTTWSFCIAFRAMPAIVKESREVWRSCLFHGRSKAYRSDFIEVRAAPQDTVVL